MGVVLCDKADSLLGTHDNKAIVWDEFCGFWLTMFAAPTGLYAMVIGFICFRFFDIVKPWPVSWCDKKIKGGLGVMLDDLAAGLLALICVQIVTYYGFIS
jgi:phosphatidylglycerophosphatase A